jgi:hypothetical protein
MKNLYCFLALILAATTSLGQTIVPPGNVSGVWGKTGSPFIITGNVSVAGSLIVEPGVVVKFEAGGWTLNAGSSAEFVARGTEADLDVCPSFLGRNAFLPYADLGFRGGEKALGSAIVSVPDVHLQRDTENIN